MFIFLTLSLLSRRWILGYLHTIPDEKLSVIVWTATTRARLSHTLNFKPARLAERVWCTQVLSSLLNNYFRLSGFHFRYGPNTCSYWPKFGTEPIRYATLHFRDRRNTASLRCSNRNEITVLVCVQKPYPVWLSYRRQSYSMHCSVNIAKDQIVRHLTKVHRSALADWLLQVYPLNLLSFYLFASIPFLLNFPQYATNVPVLAVVTLVTLVITNLHLHRLQLW